MIGVISKKSERAIVQEFFELFKTPWEFYRSNGSYEVVLSTESNIGKIEANLVIIYGSERSGIDDKIGKEEKFLEDKNLLEYQGYYFPIFGKVLIFDEIFDPFIKTKESHESIGIELYENNKKILRIGFELFQEIDFLFTKGQPAKYSFIPTLEIHISILRELILNSGIPLVEVPPIPKGYNFVACLTHDVDFVGIRRHKFDHTLFGFIYRALVRTPLGVIKRTDSWQKMIRNFIAVLSLPFVYLGITKDFMIQFSKYREIEKGLGSTFFIVPFKKNPGKDISGQASKWRATQYDIDDITREVERLISEGCEVGLHGLDAWCDSQKGRQELERISDVTGDSGIGVRMHWLYYSQGTPKILEDAGFLYDSTSGYNNSIGYLAGTTQAFFPKGAKRLLELPMHLMDTALFYPDHMNLNEKEASKRVKELLLLTQKFGGVLTINWHHRSIGPERCWDNFYVNLLTELKKKNVWFGTAKQIVGWFNKRRSVSFEQISYFSENQIQIKVSSDNDNSGPELLLRIYKPQKTVDSSLKEKKYIDMPFSGNLDTTVTV